MAPYERGDVVWHLAPFRDGGRPYVVVSGDDHPFHGEEYLVAGVTTTERDRAVPLPPERGPREARRSRAGPRRGTS